MKLSVVTERWTILDFFENFFQINSEFTGTYNYKKIGKLENMSIKLNGFGNKNIG